MAVFRTRIGLLLSLAVALLACESRDSRGEDGVPALRIADISGDSFVRSRTIRAPESRSNVVADDLRDASRPETPAARAEDEELFEASEGSQKAPTASPRHCGEARVPNVRRAAARAGAQCQADSSAALARLQI